MIRKIRGCWHYVGTPVQVEVSGPHTHCSFVKDFDGAWLSHIVLSKGLFQQL